MPSEFKMTRTVEFAETDMAGILHFSNYFRFMESVEHAFFRSLGLRVHQRGGGDVVGWARGHVECTYRKPLHNEDVVELHLLVHEKRSKSIGYTVIFRARTGDSPALTEVARGKMTTVCVHRTEDGLRARAMPPEVDAAIEVAPADLLMG